MKRSSLGWLVLGSVVIVVAAYLLDRGLYIGSSIDVSMRQGEGKFLYSKNCRYLYFTGMRDIAGGSEQPSRESAESAPCALLGSSG